MDKEQKFNDLIWKSFSQHSSYDKLFHQLNRIREIMRKHKDFQKCSAKSQFDQCVSIGIIAIHSSSKTLNGIYAITKPEDRIYIYAPDEGYQDPEPINIKSKKRIGT